MTTQQRQPQPEHAGTAGAPAHEDLTTGMSIEPWPPIETFEHDDKYVIEADLPGMSADEIIVEVSDEEIRLAGERRRDAEQQERRCVRQERHYGTFERRIPLPEGARPETLIASLESGVLTLELDLGLAAFEQHEIRAGESDEGHPH